MKFKYSSFGQMDNKKITNRWTKDNGQTNGQVDGQTYEQTKRWTNKKMDRWIDKQTCGFMVGWIDRWRN